MENLYFYAHSSYIKLLYGDLLLGISKLKLKVKTEISLSMVE